MRSLKNRQMITMKIMLAVAVVMILLVGIIIKVNIDVTKISLIRNVEVDVQKENIIITGDVMSSAGFKTVSQKVKFEDGNLYVKVIGGSMIPIGKNGVIVEVPNKYKNLEHIYLEDSEETIEIWSK